MFNNVVCTSGLIQFMSHTSVPCSSKKLSKAIANLQLFVKKLVVLRTCSLDSDCIFCMFHLHNADSCSIASSHDDFHAVTSTSSCVDRNSKNVSPSVVPQRMDLCVHFLLPTTILINKFIQQFSITGLQPVPSTNLKLDRSITTFGSILASITMVHEFFMHHDVLHELFIHHAVLNQFFIHRDLLITFTSFSTFLIRHDPRINFLIRHDLRINFPNLPLEGIERCQILNQFI